MKETELWNRILRIIEVGDTVRFKYGKVDWIVIAKGEDWIKVSRIIRAKKGLPLYRGTEYKTIYRGTSDWNNLRVIEGGKKDG